MDLDLTTLREIDELEQALSESHVQPLLLFKHSYTCGVSAEALDELRMHIEEQAPRRAAKYAMVTVQTHPDLSDEISARLGVRHETPQAILVSGGRVVWSASHFRVSAREIQEALNRDCS